MRSKSLLKLIPCVALAALALGCEDDPVRVTKVRTVGARAVVTTTDFSTGALSVAALDGSGKADVAVAQIHSDAVVRVFGGLVYVVNRYQGDNIQVHDADRGFALVRQFSVGNGSNPHDIGIGRPGWAFVTRYGEPELWVVDPVTGKHLHSIDLSPFADDDGVPEMDYLAFVGNRLFVTLQRFDTGTFTSAGAGRVVVIDVLSGQVVDADPAEAGVQAIEMANTNPFSELQVDAFTGNLYVACAGDWGMADAGVEWIDPATMTSAGTMLTGAAAGGDVTDVEIVSAERAYAVVTDAAFATKLIAFDPSTGVVLDTVHAPGDFVLQDVELAPTGDIVVADRTATAPGLRLYDATTGVEKTTQPIDVGLPPFDVTFIR